jgi:hypothetical protein
MGILELVGLGYVALLALASVTAASFCRIAKLSDRFDEEDDRAAWALEDRRVARLSGPPVTPRAVGNRLGAL